MMKIETTYTGKHFIWSERGPAYTSRIIIARQKDTKDSKYVDLTAKNACIIGYRLVRLSLIQAVRSWLNLNPY